MTISWSETPKGRERSSLTYSIRAEDGFQAGWNTRGLHEIANSVKEIREDFRSALGGNRRVNIDTHTQADRDREAAERERWREEMMTRQQEQSDSA